MLKRMLKKVEYRRCNDQQQNDFYYRFPNKFKHEKGEDNTNEDEDSFHFTLFL
jgi:hypothetical protein